MKKAFFCFLSLAMLLSCLTGCSFSLGSFSFGNDPQVIYDDISKLSGLSKEEGENYTVYTFNEFNGNGKQSFKMERTGLGDGPIYYSADLTEGSITVKYDAGAFDPEMGLVVLSANDEMPVTGSGGYVSGDYTYIIFEISGTVSGEVTISFVPLS